MKNDFAASTLFAVTLLTAMAATHAATVDVSELEANDSLASAQLLAPLAPGQTGYRVTGLRTDAPGFGPTVDASADHFRFFVPGGSLLGLDVRVTSSAPGSNRDPLLYLYDALGGVLAFDDNSGIDFGARIATFPILAGGDYIVAVTGFGDAGDIDNGGNGILTGIGGDANFAYQLSIDVAPQVVPLPGSAALLLAGAALMAGFGGMRKERPRG
jgi:murein DD-endopeptidase MepM/ murein hydrolase activator NlpD